MDKSKACEILGLSQDAGEDDVKRAYKELALKYNADHYDAGPLRDEAEQKMNELNQAFDVLMSYLRTGTQPASSGPRADAPSPTPPARYASIRQLINSGHIDEALTQLASIPDGSNNAEWNFLMGSAYYYKGWLGEALRYFQEACRLDPANAEYRAALRNLTNREQGDMPGTPYVQQDPGSAAIDCACNTCTLMCCLDMCCGGIRRC